MQESTTTHAAHWLKDGPLLLALLAGVACLVPFANKAFHIDDPLFIWAATHIQQHPVDFYGFDVNWYSYEQPMYEVTQNPPLACYYLALAGSLFGWSELALHLAFLVPALAVLWATYRLAELFGADPLLAALATLLTPVFLVSSTSVMCDTIMLALWVWSVVLWERGRRDGRPGLLYAAGLTIALCALTKYFGMALIPLLLAYSLAARQSWRHWLGPLLLAALILAGYHVLTDRLYGHGLLVNAARYATESRTLAQMTEGKTLVTVLAFLGGGVGGMAFFAPCLWPRRALGGLALAGGLTLAGFALLRLANDAFEDWSGNRLLLVGQLAVFATIGVGVLILAVADLSTRRDAPALLLFLWVAGTFQFAGYINWTVNGRSILPLTPAVAVLVTRRLAQRHGPAAGKPRFAYLALLPAAALALVVTWADYQLAESGRRAAELLVTAERSRPGTIWFQGHWGFQYYMQEWGGKPWDKHDSRPEAGDCIVRPSNTTNRSSLPKELLNEEPAIIDLRAFPCLSTMHDGVGAGFYSSIWGPLPFALGDVPDERYEVNEVIKRFPPPPK
jgi:4-amino-4-deoxy-L-arabinose transferase-like glycosyltransferase